VAAARRHPALVGICGGAVLESEFHLDLDRAGENKIVPIARRLDRHTIVPLDRR